jgi:hypothetical protein
VPSTDGPYWLFFHYGAFGTGKGQALRYVITSNGTTVASGIVGAATSFISFGQVFHAASTVVTVTFSDASSNASAAGGVLDAVSIVPFQAFNLPGKYSGVETKTITISDADISESETRRVTARISPFGEISMIEQPGSTYSLATIANDGSVNVLAPNGSGRFATATIKGSTITFAINVVSPIYENGRPQTYTRKYTLHKVGK